MADADKSDVAKREEVILAFWKEKKVFEKTLEKEAPKGEFVFYDGPPFATGTPHSGSLLSSVCKDVIPRYKTMRGYFVRRRWGWDTHGLPIESLVEKKLGLKNKKEILALGIEKFNETARGMVLEYVSEWKRYVERVGRWVDFDNSYKTLDNTFIESVWWALSEIHKKGRLYEGRKVLMYCTHDETPLAKAEIAMDETYKDITEETVTAKFKVKNPSAHGLPENTFILAWTTTPWTLPGNVGLAVGSDIIYSVLRVGEENLILASERMSVLKDTPMNVLKEIKGEELIGIEYEPLYAIAKVAKHTGKKWSVLPADFVTTEEGTGVVHTAVIYGEDDYQLGLKEGLPMVPLLNPNGTYNSDAPDFLHGKYIKKAEADIKADLESRGLIFSKENHTHRYPHCYRCGTPLIYNAVSSWFINIQTVKDKMLSENEKITWFPEHLKQGRFKHILEGAPDWTISRNRFWASPLPIWKDKDGKVTVIGSQKELKARTKKSGNRYFVMRHGQAENNVSPTWHKDLEATASLTDKGKAQVKDSAAAFKEKPDVIICSPIKRARESVALFCEQIGFPIESVVYDDRLREWEESDEFEGVSAQVQQKYYEHEYIHSPKKEFKNAENFSDVVRRAGEMLYEVEERYTGKTILFLAHAGLLRGIDFVAQGMTFETLAKNGPLPQLANAEIKEVPFVSLPHNAHYELDYHLPYIDRVELLDENGGKMMRIPEVVDCWVESGAMPFAEYHYPFENKQAFEKRAPGDFVSEYIGQTRAWFYYMHAISVVLFGRASFKNVITTGNVNAGDGQKLSKSKKNYTDPYVIFDKYGADAFRYYMMSSVVMQAEDLQFKDDEVKESYSRLINILRNTNAFYALYKDEAGPASADSDNVLDKWILAKLSVLIQSTTDAFDRYDVIRATRPFRDFVEDFSTWYVRRSRDRVKGEDEEDKKKALATMRYVLREFSKVIAPVTPFIAEEIYQGVREEREPESVHLCMWPGKSSSLFDTALKSFGLGKNNSELMEDMTEVRRAVSLGLEARSTAEIKVRQPLFEVRVKSSRLIGKNKLIDLIRDELNVERVAVGADFPEDVKLDITITPELKEKGMARELLRFVQDLRKQADFMPKDTAVLIVGNKETRIFAETHWSSIARPANLVRLEEGTATHETVIEGSNFNLDVRRS
jgi:isoleucyl-tRNA synthetase